MALQLVIALAAVLLAGTMHFYLLRSVTGMMKRAGTSDYPAYLAILVTGTIGQCVAALIFAAGYIVSTGAGLGIIEAKSPMSFADTFAHSLVNLTTLGLGDMIPAGYLKVLAGIEAMTGFLLISCTASHVFQRMKIEQ